MATGVLTSSCDVAVVGGGPAGAATAIRLARFGFSVVLIDKGGGERQHVGESLPSSVRVVLDTLGVELSGDALVARPPEHRVAWGELAVSDTRRPPSERESSLLVWRGAFDRELLGAAEREGVHVLRGSAVRTVAKDGSGRAVHLVSEARLAARFVVDASGRAGVLSRESRARESAFRTLALTGHFRSTLALGPTLVEAFRDGWVWSAPLDDGRRDVTVMLDRDAATGDSEKLFIESLAEAPRARDLLGDAPRLGKVRGIDATPYLARAIAGPDFVVVGDAASFLDPLAAHGVHKALDGALVASVVARTLLERPARADDAVQFYEQRERDIARVTAERLSRLYAQERRFLGSPFWRKRAAAKAPPSSLRPASSRPPLRGDMVLDAAPGVRIADAPVFEEDYIERREVLLAPGQERPVRFFGSVSLPDVFRRAVDAPNVEAAARTLALPFDRAFASIDWLYCSGYLEQRR